MKSTENLTGHINNYLSSLTYVESEFKEEYYNFCKTEGIPINEDTASRFIEEKENIVMNSQYQIV